MLLRKSIPRLCVNMHAIFKNMTNNSMLESRHDALQLREDVLDRFNLGIVDLAARAKAEWLYWSIAKGWQTFVPAVKASAI